MSDILANICFKNLSSEELATKVLRVAFENETPSIPIDPFLILRKFNIIYQFMDFKNLEGVYLVPETENDLAFVGINYNRPITRQRFTAAHELCHHIKDREDTFDEISNYANNKKERYAENFAAALLMPRELLELEIEDSKYSKPLKLEDALKISIKFGVSFQSCVYRLAYELKQLDGDTSNNVLSKRIYDFRPNTKKKKLGIEINDINLLSQAFDSYVFFHKVEENYFWFKFKSDFIYNDNRMEGVKVSRDKADEIISDIRLNRQASVYSNEKNKDIIQIVGHDSVYDYIFKTNDSPTIYSILKINKTLFQYAPFPDDAGKIRDFNNKISGAVITTTDYRQIHDQLAMLNSDFNKLIDEPTSFTQSEFLNKAVQIHHRLTQIHPFSDGNGRTSRALLNWMLRYRNISPFYIPLNDKLIYYNALSCADQTGNLDSLLVFFMHIIFKTQIRINKAI